MNWEDNLKQRYRESGIDAFLAAEAAFKERLQRYTMQQGLQIMDDNPEGQDWMLLLRDGSELYVDRRSFETGSEETDFWIEYRPADGGVIAEYLSSVGRRQRHHVIVPNEEIVATCEDWRS